MSQSERVPRNGYAVYISLSRAGSKWLECLVRSFRRPLVKQGLVLGVEDLIHRSEDLHTRWRWRGGEEIFREARQMLMKQSKEGKICPLCGDKQNLVEVNCRGRRDRKEIPLMVWNCRCLHPGDLECACGNPCRPMF